jgi:hypothetical protein
MVHVLLFYRRSGVRDMSYRRFNDSDGSSWEAWEVHPKAVERRGERDRRGRPRDTVERRVKHEFRLAIPLELRAGWLALQGHESRLRLFPIPNGWESLSDDELCHLVIEAAAARRAAS